MKHRAQQEELIQQNLAEFRREMRRGERAFAAARHRLLQELDRLSRAPVGEEAEAVKEKAVNGKRGGRGAGLEERRVQSPGRLRGANGRA